MASRAISRRDFLKGLGGLAGAAASGSLLASCGAPPAGAAPPPALQPSLSSYPLPTSEGLWTPQASHRGRVPTGEAVEIRVDGVGDFAIRAEEVARLRPEVFGPGHFSVFDAFAHLAASEAFDLGHHFDEEMGTHLIDSLNGEAGWWYQALYSGGWYESNAFRMDLYPCKPGTHVRLFREEREGRIEAIHDTFREEVDRLQGGGAVVLPELTIQGPRLSEAVFRNVEVRPHDLRPDVFQPGVITALDVLLSLGEEGRLSGLELAWYERMGSADVVDSYWVERIDEHEAYRSCGFVYETGPREFAGFRGSHIHIPADLRVMVAPEYAYWYWICL